MSAILYGFNKKNIAFKRALVGDYPQHQIMSD